MNGWQRLWILVSIILLVPTILIAIAFQPSSYAINQYTQGRLIEFAVNNDPSLKGSKPWEIAAAYKDIAPSDFIQRFKASYSKKHPEYTEHIDKIIHEVNQSFFWQRVFVYAKAIAAWFISICILYALGLGIGWVYQGFKRKA